MAEPDVGDLHGHRHAFDQDDLVAPVELVGLACREEQRHIRLSHCRPPCPLPALGVPADRVVAALIAERAKLLVDADQRQALALRLCQVAVEQRIELHLPGADPRLRLMFALVGEGGLVRPQYPAHRVARHVQFTADPASETILQHGKHAGRERSYPLTSSPLHPLVKTNGWSQIDRMRGRIASPRMLLDKFPPMTGAASPNRVDVVNGWKDQHGRAARGGVGG